MTTFAIDNPEDTYQRLCEHFDKHGVISKGDQKLIHITGEQATARLNDVLGPENWDYMIRSHGEISGEAWVLGELTVRWPRGETSIKQQVGTQELTRGQYAATDILKAAATDALKKCATLIGVGLYLFNADERQQVAASMGVAVQSQQQNRPTPITRPSPSGAPLACEYCGSPVEGTTFNDGKVVGPDDVAAWGRKNFGMVLCLQDYSAAKKGRIVLQPQPTEDVPF